MGAGAPQPQSQLPSTHCRAELPQFAIRAYCFESHQPLLESLPWQQRSGTVVLRFPGFTEHQFNGVFCNAKNREDLPEGHLNVPALKKSFELGREPQKGRYQEPLKLNKWNGKRNNLHHFTYVLMEKLEYPKVNQFTHVAGWGGGVYVSVCAVCLCGCAHT